MEINEQEIFQAIVRGGKNSSDGFYTWELVDSHEEPDGTFYQTTVRRQHPWEDLPAMCEIQYLKKGKRIRVLCRPDHTGHVLQDWQNPFDHYHIIYEEVQNLFPEAKVTSSVRKGGFGTQGQYDDTANLYIDFIS